MRKRHCTFVPSLFRLCARNSANLAFSPFTSLGGDRCVAENRPVRLCTLAYLIWVPGYLDRLQYLGIAEVLDPSWRENRS